MIRAIVFDFDNTLTDYVALDLRTLHHIYSLTGDRGRAEEFVAAAVEEIMVCHENIRLNRLDPRTLHETRLQSTCARLGLPWRDVYKDEYQRYLIENTVVYPNVIETLTDLSHQYALGILTNHYDGKEQRNRIAHCGVGALVKAIVTAGESGYAKPDPAIFGLMARELGVANAECVYVGDSEYYDIAGARVAGMFTVKMLCGQGAKPSAADRVIDSIGELRSALQQLASGASG